MVLNEVELVERGDDVVGADGGHVANLLDADGAHVLLDHLENDTGPVAMVGDPPEIREGSFRCPNLLFNLGELIAHRDEELAVPLPLVGGQSEDEIGVGRKCERLFHTW